MNRQDPESGTPSVSLPKAGGAIKGIGEKFTANPATGSATITVPIPVSSGRAGFGPQLTLTYDSGAGNGPFGFGWSLGLPAITRKTDRGLPQYADADDSDVFILSNSEDLTPVLIETAAGWQPEVLPPHTVDGETYAVRRYRPRIEGLFSRIERWTHLESGDVHWRSISRDNITTFYGRTGNSRIADPDPPPGGGRVFSWLICESHDDKGNAIVYDYAVENDANVDRTQVNERSRLRSANRYLHSIRYGNRVSRLVQPDLALADWLFEVVFDYDEGRYRTLLLDPAIPDDEQHHRVRASLEAATPWSCRPDSFSSHRAGFEVRTHRRCHRILMFHRFAELGAEPCLVRATAFDYADLAASSATTAREELEHQGSSRFASFIRGITQTGFARDETLPVVTVDGVETVAYISRSLPPLEFEYSRAVLHEDLLDVPADTLDNLPIGVDNQTFQFVDLDGEGIAGILAEQSDAWFYKSNLGGGRFGPMEVVTPSPSLANLAGGTQQLLDLSGNGTLDLVAFGGDTPGYYERTTDRQWAGFRPFALRPNIRLDDRNLRFVDLSGDGHADILITEDDVVTWFPSRAAQGFDSARVVRNSSEEDRAPRVVMSDGVQSIYLADMCGDGLTDVVRIRNGEVCYWPNLGHGRFGAKVAMDNAPRFDRPDQFRHERLRLTDIDGSGVTDILYLGDDGVRLYFNQSGNSWSRPHLLAQTPPLDNLATIATADLLGNGTACLVWSSPLPADARRPLRYIDLMGGIKPHLLVTWANNLGAETHLHYVSSTTFYLADTLAGRPWITRLPFPLQVVDRVEIHDRISGNRLVTRSAYHHGYFDGVDREFRGFGMVEQWDTEEFAALAAGAVPAGTNFAETSHVPPVLTRTWFHTGGFFDRTSISNYFAGLRNEADPGEYYREPGLTDDQARDLLLDDTVLPPGLSVEDERECCRALKGLMLRREIYALDGSDKQPHPYTVVEQNFTLVPLQPKGDNAAAVVFTQSRESIDYHYERNPADPRIAHALTLEVDAFGNVLKSAAIAYGRRQPDLSLSPAERTVQATVVVACTEEDVTNPIDTLDAYRAPLSCETRSYELTGLSLPPGLDRFRFDDVRAAAAAAVAIPYEQTPAANVVQKRLVERTCTLFRRDDFAGPLPLGQMHSLAIQHESYKLALTPGLVSQVYGGRVTDAILAEGGYVHLLGDANWWAPSGRVFFSPDPAHTPGQELTFAREHFFLPHRYRDPFHTNLDSTEKFVRYDDYGVVLAESRDAFGNVMTAFTADDSGTVALRVDYRTLQPYWMTDPNGNRTRIALDAMGMVAGTAVMGKAPPAAPEGDSLAGFDADLTDAVIANHLANPTVNGAALLQSATTRLVYDLFAYMRTQHQPRPQPVVLYAMSRETHESDGIPAGGLRIQHSFTYGDGFGREIQKKIQAEAGPAPQRGPGGEVLVDVDGQPLMTADDVSPRWVAQGWKVFNNKGKPVREYEPFFTDTHAFEFDVRIGFSPVVCYDPLERVIATLRPDHTWEKLVFDAWKQVRWDANDTVLIANPAVDADVGDFFNRLPVADYLPTWHAHRIGGSLGPQEQAAARKTEIHAGSPTAAHADSQGRTFLTVAWNKYKYSDVPPAAPPTEASLSTRLDLNFEGRERHVIDALDRIIIRYDYDMLGEQLHQHSMEAGARWVLNDVLGKQIRAWDSRNAVRRATYDRLRRPVEVFIREQSGPERLVMRTAYGESMPSPEAANLRGRIVRSLDPAGVVLTDAFDFKGNLLRISRQLAQTYDATLDWTQAVALDTTVYTHHTVYDALNRVRSRVTPDNTTFLQSYNEANLLERVDAHVRGAAVATTFVAAAAYDAAGRRTRIEYGNGVTTTCTYDARTARLTDVETRRNPATFPDDCPAPAPAGWPGCQVQNVHYTYDPSGNITHVRDRAQQTVYFRNRRVEPSADYLYDALYRLIEATGREHLGQTGGAPVPSSYNDVPRVGMPFAANDGHAVGSYLERYIYNAVGNLDEMIHRGSDPVHPGWTRTFTYDEASTLEPSRRSNRLTHAATGGATETYSTGGDGYDGHGSMLRMPHLQTMQWDPFDQLRMTRRQAVSASDEEGAQVQGERTWYVYDFDGQRVRKVTELASGQIKEERVYLGNLEIYRRHGTSPLVRETLHVLDDRRRLALVDTRTQGSEPGTSEQLIRYQHGNHLDSVNLELDGEAGIISYEEYTPYGATVYQAVRGQTPSGKHYRFVAKERDEESGLYYHGARYYVPWLARWTAADPLGVEDGPNLYAYGRCNPVGYIDPDGKENIPANDTDRAIMMMEDAELYTSLKNMTPEARAKFAGAATGAFSNRAWAMLDKYGMERVYTLPEITIEGERPPPPPPPIIDMKNFEPCYRPGFEPPASKRPQKFGSNDYDGPTIGPPVAQPARVIARKNGEVVWGGSLEEAEAGMWLAAQTGATLDDGITLEVVPPVAGPPPEEPDILVDPPDPAIISGTAGAPASRTPSGRSGGSLARRPAHVYEILWTNLDTGESGVFKFGISRQVGGLNAKGQSPRALEQISEWNRALQAEGIRFRLSHGRVWGEGQNGMQLNSAMAHWAEQYKVTEHHQLTGRVPAGNQSPGPFRGTTIPRPPRRPPRRVVRGR